MNFQAWSRIIHTLIPNVQILEQHLNSFSKICNAEEVVLFERTTFLVIARSAPISFDGEKKQVEGGKENEGKDNVMEGFPEDSKKLGNDGKEGLHPERFEKVSELVKKFKLSCS